MSVEFENRPAAAAPEGEEKPSRKDAKRAKKEEKAAQKKAKKSRVPQKRTLNLYYKPDRTTKPATVALYVLFVLVCLLGLGKLLVYDLWVETTAAQRTLAAAEEQLNGVMRELTDYNEVRERYQRYSATDEERELIDRIEVLALLDEAVGSRAQMESIAISGDTVQILFSGVTLAQTAQIVQALEASPIVASTTVNTASTTDENAPRDDSAPVQANALIRLQKEVAE